MIGQSYCNKAKIKLRQLKELKKSFCLLEREMAVNLCELSEAVNNIAARCSEPEVKNFFEKIGKNMGYDNVFAQVFEDSLKESTLMLDDEIINNMVSAGKAIGYMDLENNSNMIGLIIRELDDVVEEENKKMTDKLKVYRTVSIAAGIGLAIIFI